MNRIQFYGNLNKYKDNQENKSDELKHYGTLGQKWGVRKWQNPDGTFNEAGKERYFGKKSSSGSADEKIGGYASDHFHKNIYLKTDKNTLKKIKKYPDIYNTEGLTDDEILQAVRRVAKIPNAKAYGRAIRNELYNAQLNKTRSKYYESNTKDIPESENIEDQKLGSTIPVVPLAIGIATGVTNYNDTQALRAGYDKIMSDNPENYSKEDRLAIMNNKKKIAKMEYALEKGDQEKYEKLLKKVKGEEAQNAVKKLISDMNKEALKHPVKEETQKALEDTLSDNKLGSISKPKVNKKHLNEDGTLTKEGTRKMSSKQKVADVASSVFKALRNMNIYEAVVGGPALFALTMSGFGVPMALGLSLGTIAAGAAGAGIDNALYKKLENRADAYYEMLK